MIEINRIAFFVVGLLFFSLVTIGRLLSGRHGKIERERVHFFFGVYLLLLVAVTLFPIVLQFGEVVIVRSAQIHWEPISSFWGIMQGGWYFFLINIVGNLLLLTPFTFFLMVYKKERFDRVRVIILVSFCVSVGIESLQYVESTLIAGVGRFVDITDVLLNTCSGWLGYQVYKWLEKR